MADPSDERASTNSGFDKPQSRRPPEAAPTAPVEFTCPRCGEDVTESLYGPCSACREALKVRFAASPEAAEAGASRQGVSGDEPTRPQETWIDNL